MKNLAFRVCKTTPDGSKDCNWASAFRPGLLKDGEFIEVANSSGDFIPIEEWDTMIHKLPYADWHIALGDAIKSARAGDIILVHNQAQKELGESAAKFMRPNVKICFQIEEEEEWLL